MSCFGGRPAGSADFLMRSKAAWNYGPEVQGFQSTDLSGSTLEAADLSRAVIAGVILKRTSLARAIFQGTILDTAHRGASHITTAALASLKLPLPERFLRGIGLQDWQIQDARLHRSLYSGTSRPFGNRLAGCNPAPRRSFCHQLRNLRKILPIVYCLFTATKLHCKNRYAPAENFTC